MQGLNFVVSVGRLEQALSEPARGTVVHLLNSVFSTWCQQLVTGSSEIYMNSEMRATYISLVDRSDAASLNTVGCERCPITCHVCLSAFSRRRQSNSSSAK